MVYCTTAEVKTYSGIAYTDLGFSSDTDLDNFITTLISAAEEIINDYCGRDFTQHDDVAETHDGKGENFLWSESYPKTRVGYMLFPKHYPIIAVDSLSYDGSALSSGDIYAYDTYIKTYKVPMEKWQNIELTYDYGYASVPETVKMVCIRLISKMLGKAVQIRGGRGAAQLGIGDLKVVYDYAEYLDDELRAMLSKYKKVSLMVV